ncbi:hypothetical protein ACFQV2_03110 [Actinokineospora soli]|uniref:DUF2613 domain-containing protein n=1 Tax=Actinokineospora soli TaxID=1048753 RepID=A0ABW2TGD0_9PSEU
MVKLIVGAVAAVIVGGAAATGTTFALVSAKAPDKGVEFGVEARDTRTAVDYGKP